jgi:hypothetical protein
VLGSSSPQIRASSVEKSRSCPMEIMISPISKYYFFLFWTGSELVPSANISIILWCTCEN